MVFAVGATTIRELVGRGPGCHVKPLTADTAVSVDGYPWQIKAGEALVDTGSGATTMVVVATVIPQPF
jgi:hypothetical protein